MFESRKPRGQRSTVPYWNTIKLAPGKQWLGWRAGPTVGVESHWQFGCRVCRGDLTDGALACPMCTALEWRPGTTRPTRFRAYMPLWDEAGVRTVAIISETYFRLSEEVKPAGRCVVTKILSRGCPLRVDPRPDMDRPGFLSGAERQPQDLRPWLLRVWKDAELEAWVRERAGPQRAKGKQSIVTPTTEIVMDHDAINRRFAAATKASAIPPDLGVVSDNVLSRLNGVHKRKPK